MRGERPPTALAERRATAFQGPRSNSADVSQVADAASKRAPQLGVRNMNVRHVAGSCRSVAVCPTSWKDEICCKRHCWCSLLQYPQLHCSEAFVTLPLETLQNLLLTQRRQKKEAKPQKVARSRQPGCSDCRAARPHMLLGGGHSGPESAARGTAATAPAVALCCSCHRAGKEGRRGSTHSSWQVRRMGWFCGSLGGCGCASTHLALNLLLGQHLHLVVSGHVPRLPLCKCKPVEDLCQQSTACYVSGHIPRLPLCSARNSSIASHTSDMWCAHAAAHSRQICVWQARPHLQSATTHTTTNQTMESTAEGTQVAHPPSWG